MESSEVNEKEPRYDEGSVVPTWTSKPIMAEMVVDAPGNRQGE